MRQPSRLVERMFNSAAFFIMVIQAEDVCEPSIRTGLEVMRLDDLQEMIAQEQWEDISGKLNDILDPLSRQDIDEFVSSINGSCKYWAQMLVNTGLFRDDGKAGYLTRRIFMRIWDGSTYHNKWILLKTFLELYDIPFDHGENSSLAGFLLTMQIRTGIHPRDVLDLFIYQQKNNGKITASMPFSVQ